MLTVTEALEKITTHVVPLPAQTQRLENSLGCALATDIASPTDSPPFDKSMMDGYAVIASDLSVGETQLQIVGEVTAGAKLDQTLQSGEAIRIMTGAPIPAGADAVIPVEQSSLIDDRVAALFLKAEVPKQYNIIRRGSNMATGEIVLRQSHVIRPQETALLAEMGFAEIQVHRKPRVAILATGDELVPIDELPGPSQIRNSNAVMLAAQVAAAGAEPVVLGIARDNRNELREKIHLGLACDFLCLSGGVSAGKLDLVPSELQAAGVEQVFHKVAMKPGKPIWFGMRQAHDQPTCHVFGLPGNPVSSMVCFELFVRTALRQFSGVHPAQPSLIRAELTTDVEQSSERDVWFPAKLELVTGVVKVTPVNWKGSSDLRSTVEANSSVHFPANQSKFSAGERLDVLLWGTSESSHFVIGNKGVT